MADACWTQKEFVECHLPDSYSLCSFFKIKNASCISRHFYDKHHTCTYILVQILLKIFAYIKRAIIYVWLDVNGDLLLRH